MKTAAINSKKIDLVLRRVASQRSVASRVAELSVAKSDDWLKKVMEYTYSPYIRFGLKLDAGNIRDLFALASPDAGLDIDDPDIWNLLDQFRTSTASSMAKFESLKALAGRLNINTMSLVAGIINKSVVQNVSESTVNKVWPDLIPVFSVQLANKYTDRKIKSFPQYVEVKYDGLRATSIIQATGEVQVLTRTGREIPAAAYFHAELIAFGKAYAEVVDKPEGRNFAGCVTDGELCGDSFLEAVSTFRSDKVATSGTYAIFDVLPMESLTNPAFVSDPYVKRQETLRKIFEVKQTIAPAPFTSVVQSKAYIANSKEEIWSLYNKARENNLEGVIVKNPNGLWTRKRTNDWMKIKAEETADLRIIGAFEGEGDKTGTLGGLIVDFNGVSVRVGSGFTDETSDRLWAAFLRDLERHERGDTDFELIGYLAEIQYQEVTPAGSLRHPVFIRLRADKDEVSF